VLIVRAICARALNRTEPSRHAILRYRSSAVWPSIAMQTVPFVLDKFYPGVPYKMHVADRFIEFPRNGGEIWLGGLDEKERVDKILGNEYSSLYLNECSQIPYNSVLVALSRLAQNVGLKQRAYFDLNPVGVGHWSNVLFGQKRDPISKKPLTSPEDYVREFINPVDNAMNLTPEFLKSLEELPERARKRFFEGSYQEEASNALWTYKLIEETRVAPSQVPDLQRVIVAVDPSGADNEMDANRDDIGIAAAGLGVDGHCYVLDDATLLAGPEKWAREAIMVYKRWKADRIVGERNFGGAMVEYVLRSVDPSIPYSEVTASRGKVQRAEPAAALYSRRMVHHVGNFEELETELTEFTDMGYIGAGSPNRADALIWALHELVLKDEDATGWVDYYRSKAEKAGILPKQQRREPQERRDLLGQPHPPEFIVVYTSPGARLYISMPNGGSRTFTANDQGAITAPIGFKEGLLHAGCLLTPGGD